MFSTARTEKERERESRQLVKLKSCERKKRKHTKPNEKENFTHYNPIIFIRYQK